MGAFGLFKLESISGLLGKEYVFVPSVKQSTWFVRTT
jgi:hypothetical protein